MVEAAHPAPPARGPEVNLAWLQRYNKRLETLCPASRPHADLVRLEAGWTCPGHDDDPSCFDEPHEASSTGTAAADETRSPAQHLAAIAYVCEEAQLLAETAQHQIFPAVAASCEGGDGDVSDAAVLARTQTAATQVRTCTAFCLRCSEVALALWDLLAGLDNRSEHFLAAWAILANLLGILVAVDTLVQDNETLQRWWTRLLPDACRAEGLIDPCSVRGQWFEALLKKLTASPANVAAHHAALQRASKLLVKDFDAEWRAASREDESFPSYECESKFVGFAALCQLCDRATGSCDAWRLLHDLNKLIPVVPLCGRTIWSLDAFVDDKAGGRARRKEYTQRLVASLAQRVPAYAGQVAAWVASVTGKEANPERSIVHALALAHRVRRALTMTLRLHAEEELPMSKHLISQHIAVCIELLMVIRDTARSELGRGAKTARTRILVVSSVFTDVERQVAVWKHRLGNGESPDAIAKAGLSMLTRASSGAHLDRARVALGAVSSLVSASGSGLCKWEEVVRLERQLERLRLVTRWQTNLDRACTCSMLYWDADTLLPLMLRSASPPRVKLLTAAFGEAALALFGQKTTDADAFRDRLVATVREYYVDPLCVRVDEALRLHQHAVHMEHLAAAALEIDELRSAVHVGPLEIMDASLHTKTCVEHYLQRQFYNMTVLSLHDWRSYREMQKVAMETLGISVADSTLPQGGLDAQVDILELMRHWDTFVSQYTHNLSQQFFVERRLRRGAKHLRTVSVQTIADSVGTHGLGILSTCVNFAYQFLTRSVSEVANALLEEPVKSYLARERRWFASHAKSRGIDHKYPFERAFRYSRDSRGLGDLQSGPGLVFHLCELLTHIGNTLGFVRMVRVAGRRWVADAVQTIPLLDVPSDASEYVNGRTTLKEEEEQEQEQEKEESATTLLCKKFDMGKDYLRVLVDVFRRALGNADDKSHLDNFFMLVPALTVHFVESLMSGEDQLSRSHQGREAFFTDDGFAVGVAYMLTILGETEEFSALLWFASLQQAFAQDIRDLRGASSVSREDATRVERLERFRRHFRLLEFALESSLVFFKLS
ncbi:WASH complex subunit 4 [Hondaea fermentalgiana]|uniref:WASH complex subunit 4 n=1 Tax=Hondaea fermentalgiana TaxID=2315210 RepID=A0A2R5GIQ1_9STRA|nr:WASH complex subunit 4 [Hondaea fermentalgiana]|eukprot:GBG30766.1 WASH complex subunit 4 [Hondaea fermentalgiana]